jgi:hypothetical protein
MNYAKRFVELGAVPLTPLQKAQIVRLEAADKLCDKCNLQDGMLCSGVRPYLLPESEYYKTPKINLLPCHKLTKKREDKTAMSKYENARIPKAAWYPVYAGEKETKTVKLDYDRIIYGGRDCPPLTYRIADIKDTVKYWELIAAAIKSGYTAKYAYLPVVVTEFAKRREELIHEFVEHCDLLVVERLDIESGVGYMGEVMFSMIDQRISKQLPTIISLSSRNIQTDHEYKREIYKEILSWPQNNLI